MSFCTFVYNYIITGSKQANLQKEKLKYLKTKHGLNDDTIECLTKHGFNSVEEVELLHGKHDQIEKLGLSLAQTLLLEKFLESQERKKNALKDMELQAQRQKQETACTQQKSKTCLIIIQICDIYINFY